MAKKKSAVLLGIGVSLLLFAAALTTWLFLMQKATNLNSNPYQIDTQQQSLFPTVDWQYWKSVNPDIVGWITVLNTNIDYPIVHAPKNNPTFYLEHDIFKNWNWYGSVYLDADCESLDAQNAVVFAHHINDGSMFSDFAQFNNPEVSRPAIILIQTPEWQKQLQVDAVDVIDGSASLKQTAFKDESEFQSYRKRCLMQSDLCFEDDEEPINQMFTFCTCSYNFLPQNERTLVYASENRASDQPN